MTKIKGRQIKPDGNEATVLTALLNGYKVQVNDGPLMAWDDEKGCAVYTDDGVITDHLWTLTLREFIHWVESADRITIFV